MSSAIERIKSERRELIEKFLAGEEFQYRRDSMGNYEMNSDGVTLTMYDLVLAQKTTLIEDRWQVILVDISQHIYHNASGTSRYQGQLKVREAFWDVLYDHQDNYVPVYMNKGTHAIQEYQRLIREDLCTFLRGGYWWSSVNFRQHWFYNIPSRVAVARAVFKKLGGDSTIESPYGSLQEAYKSSRLRGQQVDRCVQYWLAHYGFSAEDNLYARRASKVAKAVYLALHGETTFKPEEVEGLEVLRMIHPAYYKELPKHLNDENNGIKMVVKDLLRR